MVIRIGVDNVVRILSSEADRISFQFIRTGSRIRSCPDKNLNIEYHLARKAVFDAGENPGALSYNSCRHASPQLSLYEAVVADYSDATLFQSFFLYTTKYPITVSDSTVHSLIGPILSNMENYNLPIWKVSVILLSMSERQRCIIFHVGKSNRKQRNDRP
jgi:hypothetical protein